jgi:two-component system, NarL family, nitrate/nitrite response regulator NarL
MDRFDSTDTRPPHDARLPMTTAERPLRVLLVDDHAVVRAGLRLLLEHHGGYEVVGEAGCSADALDRASGTRPDVVLLDLDLGGDKAIDFFKDLRAAAGCAKILLLTSLRDPEMHRRAIRLGARGLVAKQDPAESLFKSIRKVHDGELWVDRVLTAEILSEMVSGGAAARDPEQERIASLTPREREVIELVALGLKNKEIACRLFVSDITVRHHLTSVFAKLEVQDRLALVLYAFQHGLAHPPK